MARKKKNKSTKDLPLRTKLTTLEAAIGQKAAAEKLGISTSTFRNWKTGKNKKPLEEDKIKRINRVYGHNKKKATFSNLKQTVKVERARRAGKEKQIQNRIENNDPFLVSAKNFIKKLTKDKDVIERFMSIGYEYVATFDYKRGQIVSAFDISYNLYGKPSGTKKVYATGLYSNHYLFEEESESYKGYLSGGRMPTLDGLKENWGLSKTLDYLENKFLSTSQQVGKRRDNAVQFIAYYLM